jgi:hypothetical protein
MFPVFLLPKGEGRMSPIFHSATQRLCGESASSFKKLATA